MIKNLRLINLLIFGFLITFSSNGYSNSNFDIDDYNCEQLQVFGSETLDRSQFFADFVVSKVETLVKEGNLQNCESFALILTIFGFQKYIKTDVIAGRLALLKADSIYRIDPLVNIKYNIRNNIFLGLNYSLNQDTTQALYCLHKAVDMSIKNDHPKLHCDALHNIGVLYLRHDKLVQAKKYLHKSNVMALESRNHEIYAFSNLSLSHLFRKQKTNS